MRYSFVDEEVPMKQSYIVTGSRRGEFVTLRRATFEEADRTKRRLWALGYVAVIEWEPL